MYMCVCVCVMGVSVQHLTAISRIHICVCIHVWMYARVCVCVLEFSQISSSYPTATFCRFPGIEPATFCSRLDFSNTEPHAHDISTDIVRVGLSGCKLHNIHT